MITNRVMLKAFTASGEIQNSGMDQAEQVMFTRSYPGGMCTAMTFYVARRVDAAWAVGLGTRIAAYNGLRMVWEGWVTGITPTVTADRQGISVTVAGAWATYLMARKTIKSWADARLDDTTWAWYTPLAGAEKCTVDRNKRIRFTPKAEAWLNGEYALVTYIVPTGQTIKRITLDYDLQEGGQAWELSVYNVTSSSNLLSRTTSNATPGVTVAWDSGTLATPTQRININLIARANQTAKSDGTYYGEVQNVVVYTETGAINAQEIAKDIAALVPEISTDISRIGAITVDLVPFIAETETSYADLITNAVNYGDSSYNRWASYLGLSTGDGKPIFFLEQSPLLSDWDYAIRMDDANVTSDLAFRHDLDGVANWIAAKYQDVTGGTVYMTPDDDATFKDTSSIASYGQRDFWVSLPTTNQAAVQNYCRRYLDAHKLPQWIATGQVEVAGFVRAKSGKLVPACEVLPGKRIRIENWLADLSGSGLTFLISGTTYTDDSETCAMDIGMPDTLEFAIFRMQRIMDLGRSA